MKLLYFGKLTDNSIYEEKVKEKNPYFVAQFMYESTLKREFERNEEFEVKYISIYQTDYFPKNSLFINKNEKRDSNFYYLPFINIPFFRELSYFMCTMFQIFNWYIKNFKNEKIIYSSNHFPPVSLGIILLGKLLNLTKVVTFTDLSLFSYSEKKIKQMKLYKKIMMKPYLRLVNYLQQQYDGYILFSNQMNEIVNPYKKPNIVIEGIFNSTSVGSVDRVKYENKKIVTHAGTLNKEVGIDKIVSVFRELQTENIELWLIGNGDYVDTIKEIAKIDSRIKYLGFLPKKEVFKKLTQSTVLVNFRNPKDEYTKYSFPSKLFEYMVSGTPVFTTALDGIPPEYYEYMFSSESYDDLQLSYELDLILNKTPGELNDISYKSSEFILNNKTSGVQGKKILDFLNNLI